MDAVAPATSADLVDVLTTRYPVLVMLRLLDLPDRLAGRMQRRSTEILGPTVGAGRARRGARALTRTLAPVVRSRRGGGRPDLVSRIATAELDGRPLSDEEVLSSLRLLIPAATDTPYRASSTLLHALLTHPEQLRLVREDRALLDDAFEEALRWECPLLSVTRGAAEDVHVLGVDVPEGAMVIVDLGAANRDPQRWVEPDRFDILRPRKTNLAFSGGPHLCAGIHMAKAEIPAMLDTLLERFPRLRLDERGQVPPITGTEWRVPVAVPARWD
jgi:cytochrome P450